MMRRMRRAVALAFALAASVLRYWQMRLRGPLTPEQRALWMQFIGRAVLASLEVGIRVEGQPPRRGLLVANHLGYLDIAVLSVVAPSAFISRADVTSWPLFGRMSRWGGTIYLDRSSLASANAVARRIAGRLALLVPVVLFAEGTSTDGTEVLPFRSRLFQPATHTGASITAAALRYRMDDGPDGPVEEREVCFYGAHHLLPHLWNLLGLPPFTATVHFGKPRVYAHAREAAEKTHAEVVEMRAACARQLLQARPKEPLNTLPFGDQGRHHLEFFRRLYCRAGETAKTNSQ